MKRFKLVFLIGSDRFFCSFSCLALLCTVALSGCNSGPDMAEVTGKVSYKGNSVPKGKVTFYPSGGGRPATGDINEDGTYSLSSFDVDDGALLGDYKVSIEAKNLLNVAPGPKTFEEEADPTSPVHQRRPIKTEWLVPEKYSSPQSSGLTATVEGKKNVIDFNLQ